MKYQLFGLDESNQQVYSTHISSGDGLDAETVADNILKRMNHIKSVVVVKTIPNITQIEDSFMVKVDCNFKFIKSR